MVTKEAIYQDDSYDKNRILAYSITRYHAFSKWARLTFKTRNSIVYSKHKLFRSRNAFDDYKNI